MIIKSLNKIIISDDIEKRFISIKTDNEPTNHVSNAIINRLIK